MPVSHNHKCIFVHIPKTGGSSICKALGVFGVDNEGSLVPSLDIFYGVKFGKALQHLTLLEIKNYCKEDYFTFAFVRNPFDKVVSEYCWRKENFWKANAPSFKEFLLEIKEHLKGYLGRGLLSDHLDEQNSFFENVDFIGRFENLEADFKKVCDRLGIVCELPHIQKSSHKHYRDYYDEFTKKLVSDLYKTDLELFKYTF